jgi:hypothetical protein
MRQPSTAKQLARKTGIPVDTCSYLIVKCSDHGLFRCLNPKVRSSRLYWLTGLGDKCRRRLHRDLGLPHKELELPNVDWPLYGWVCFKHRSAVIRILSNPMQPSEIKRLLRIHQSSVKISANNIRDIVKLLSARKIARPVKVKKKAHLRYELTELGNQLRQLLLQA